MLVKKSGFEPPSQSSKTWPGWGWTVHCSVMLLLQTHPLEMGNDQIGERCVCGSGRIRTYTSFEPDLQSGEPTNCSTDPKYG